MFQQDSACSHTRHSSTPAGIDVDRTANGDNGDELASAGQRRPWRSTVVAIGISGFRDGEDGEEEEESAMEKDFFPREPLLLFISHRRTVQCRFLYWSSVQVGFLQRKIATAGFRWGKERGRTMGTTTGMAVCGTCTYRFGISPLRLFFRNGTGTMCIFESN